MKHRWTALLAQPPRHRQVIAFLVVLAALFGGIVMHKSVGLSRPQGDLRVFCCAGWAIRQGGHLLYQVRDDNGWHYHYPPTFAILMAPLADPPRRDLCLSAASATGVAWNSGGYGGLQAACALAASPAATGAPLSPHVPYAATVAVFYLFNLACLAVAVGLVRIALRGEDKPDLPWSHRYLPLLVCAPAIGWTLARGQVQLLLLALLAGFLVGLVRGKRFVAGLCLAGAICLKIFPGYLLLVPLVRRDGRCLVGCVVGLLVGLVVLPVAVIGPQAMARLYLDRADFVTSVFRTDGSNRPGAEEMLDATATHSQSFQMVLHKTLHLGAEETPALPAAWVRATHWILALALTLAVCLPGGMRDEQGLALARRVALLTLLMVLVCPVCHLHYFALAMPVVAVLLVPPVLPGRGVVLGGFLGAVGLSLLPGLGALHDLGLPMYAALAVGVACWRWGWPEREPTISARVSCEKWKCEVGWR